MRRVLDFFVSSRRPPLRIANEEECSVVQKNSCLRWVRNNIFLASGMFYLGNSYIIVYLSIWNFNSLSIRLNNYLNSVCYIQLINLIFTLDGFFVTIY